MGSTGRKRPADQMMSGGEGAASEEPQRPDKKSKSGRKKKDKKRGKGKGKKDGSSSKSNKDGSSASASAGNSLETTATAEGKQMAQVLSTFSRMEQSRFEAFRKAAFSGDAISRFVAHCLLHEQHRPVSAGSSYQSAVASACNPDEYRTAIPGAQKRLPHDRDGKPKARFRHLRPGAHYQRRAVLSELVAPGQAGDVIVVVSTLAKEYAQRLVLAARKHAAERVKKQHNKESNNYADDEPEEDAAISPEDLLKAHADRQARGLDPGFFLEEPVTKNARASEASLLLSDPESHQRYDLLRSVALAAQETYDKELEKEEQENEENDDDNEEEEEEETADKDAMAVEDNDNGDADVDMTEAADGETPSNKAADEMAKGHWDEDEEDDSEDDYKDASEEAVKLFSKHVNRMIARQHGITVVTSDDEEPSSPGKTAPPSGDTNPSPTKEATAEAEGAASMDALADAAGLSPSKTASSDPAAASSPPKPLGAAAAESTSGTPTKNENEVILIDDDDDN